MEQWSPVLAFLPPLLPPLLPKQGLHDIPVCGYWGDIVSSPFLSFGIDSEDTQLMKDHTGEELKKVRDDSKQLP